MTFSNLFLNMEEEEEEEVVLGGEEDEEEGGIGSGDALNTFHLNLRREESSNESEEEDQERTRQQLQNATLAIPEPVKLFIQHLFQAIQQATPHELHSLYDQQFNKLSETHYSRTSWPDPHVVMTLVEEESQWFMMLYRELYYRHLYSKLSPSLQQRIESFETYCDLFNHLLNPPAENTILLCDLPSQWLWDIVDEFIYQFQSFNLYRAKLRNKSDVEISSLQSSPEIWNLHSVLNVLNSLIDKSQINETASSPDTLSEEHHGEKLLYKKLGYFSLVGLLRIHCLLGDYYLALRIMDQIDLYKRNFASRVNACYVTAFYYVAFAYMMTRRYSDAIHAFSHILLFVSRTKQYHAKSLQYDTIVKKNEQMYALLAFCVSICPERVDENIHTTLKEKFWDQMSKMHKGGDELLAAAEELFTLACPKFICPSIPDYDCKLNVDKEPFQHQLKLFLREVQQQASIPIIRSYLKLYTSLNVVKLASFLDLSVDELRSELISNKHKVFQKRHTDGSLIQGTFAENADIHFHLEDDTIFISESKTARQFGNFFIRNAQKLETMIQNISHK